MTRWCRLAAGVCGLLVVASACASGSSPHAAPSRRVVVRGAARLDGHAFDARWIGAVVRRDGLVTPCQAALPPVRDGRFAIPVFRRAASAGCGTAGSEILFWSYHGTRLFADRWVPWSRATDPVTVRFSSSSPEGAAPPLTEISGHAFDARGRPVPLGTRIEARVDATVCGVASVRADGGFRGYILNIVGPDTIPGCRADATITFRIGASAATQTAQNGRSERGLFRLSAASA